MTAAMPRCWLLCSSCHGIFARVTFCYLFVLYKIRFYFFNECVLFSFGFPSILLELALSMHDLWPLRSCY